MSATEMDYNSDSDLDEPEHTFESHKQMVNGKEVFVTKLLLPPHYFNLRKNGKKTTFSCQTCEDLGEKAYAKAERLTKESSSFLIG